MAGRVIYAGLDLLDRQLLDRHGRNCGNVDDLELDWIGDSQHLYVTEIVTGPGALARRFGARQFGGWMRRFIAFAFPNATGDPGRIPFARVTEVGAAVTLAAEKEELSTFAVEKWARDHVIAHIPGSRHDAGE
jgi:sporulation protein YlmC with PRC-barrel domain